MAADSAGNDILNVGVPITGKIAIAPEGTTMPTDEDFISPSWVLPVAFTPIGLVKESGGPQLAWAADGEPIEFWQDEYTIPSGAAVVTLTVTAAEVLGNIVRGLVAGAAPNVDGITYVDGGGHALRYVVYIEEIFKNGAIRRRLSVNAGLQSVTEDQSARADVLGQQLVFDFRRHADTDDKHFQEVVLPAA